MNDSSQQIDAWLRAKMSPPRPEPEQDTEPQPKSVTDVRGLKSGNTSTDATPDSPDKWLRRLAARASHRGG